MDPELGYDPQDGSADSSPADTQQQDPQAQAGAETGGAPGGGSRERYIPRERFDEVNGALQTTRQQLQQLEQRFSSMGDMLAGRQPGQPADPRREAIRNQLFELFPEFREFVDNRDAILRAGSLA